MAARDTPERAVPETIDLEHGTKRDPSRDRVAPNGQNLEVTPQWRKRLSARTPAPVARWNRKVVDWIKGPKPLSRYTITPFLERWQTLPVRLLARLPEWLRICVYAAACIVWIVVFAVVISDGGLPSDIGGLGAPVKLSCINNLWYGLSSCTQSCDDCTDRRQAFSRELRNRRPQLPPLLQRLVRLRLPRRLLERPSPKPSRNRSAGYKLSIPGDWRYAGFPGRWARISRGLVHMLGGHPRWSNQRWQRRLRCSLLGRRARQLRRCDTTWHQQHWLRLALSNVLYLWRGFGQM